MTAPTVLPHILAVKAALTTAGLTTYLGGAPAGTLPKTYVVLYPNGGQATASSLADDRTTLDTLLQTTCVASTPEGALGTADRVRASLAGTLAVANRALWRPEELGGPPLQRDDDLSPPLFYVVVQWRLRSIPD